jgi:hypothetical protein
MSTRLTLALPVDVARLYDQTVTETQIDADTVFNNPDNIDLLASYIEDAEDEFRQQTDTEMRVARVGVAGQRETYENVKYDLNGHQNYKANWTGVSGNYLPQEVKTNLRNDRILPFDPDAGDELYIYRGLGGRATPAGDTWDDITDERGESWAITDYSDGEITFDPTLLYESRRSHRHGVGLGGHGQLRELEVAVSYRYGGLGGSRGRAAQTDLAESLDSTQTGSVNVADGSGFPVGDGGGSIIVLVGREYLSVTPDPANNSMTINERGVRGTSAESHGSGDRVQYTPPGVRKAVASRAGKQAVSSARYEDWLPDTEDSLDKSDVIDELEQTWTQTVNAMS